MDDAIPTGVGEGMSTTAGVGTGAAEALDSLATFKTLDDAVALRATTERRLRREKKFASQQRNQASNKDEVTYVDGREARAGEGAIVIGLVTGVADACAGLRRATQM